MADEFNYSSATYTSWEGLLGGFDRNNDRIFWAIQDAREMGYPLYTNSSSSWFSGIGSYVNIYDGLYHNFIFGWNSSTTSISGTSQNYHRLGIVGIDNYVFSPDETNSVSGKSTPLEFVFNDVNEATQWAFGGYYPTAASCTSTDAFYQSTKNFNGVIDSITVWDTMLTGIATLTSTNRVSSNIGGTWGAAANSEHPLTGTNLVSASSRVIAYWDFSGGVVNSLSSIDYAGTSVSGAQVLPATGHVLNSWGAKMSGEFSYLLYDVNNNNPSISLPSGIVQFVDENGNIRNVGTIFYELGIIVFDNEYLVDAAGSNSGLPFIRTMSISSMGFNTTTGINVNYVSFVNEQNTERMIISAKSESGDFNYTLNPTGIIKTTGEQRLKTNQGTYPTSIGLYNAFNDLIAIAKLDTPIRKDEDHTVTINVNIDF
jgi:hypothetical protein